MLALKYGLHMAVCMCTSRLAAPANKLLFVCESDKAAGYKIELALSICAAFCVLWDNKVQLCSIWQHCCKLGSASIASLRILRIVPSAVVACTYCCSGLKALS